MKNVLQIKNYVFINWERSFSTFGQFLQQNRKSFHKIIKFAIFMKNGGSTVDPKTQALNSDWAKKVTKKDTKIIFFSSESWDVAFSKSETQEAFRRPPSALFCCEKMTSFWNFQKNPNFQTKIGQPGASWRPPRFQI